MTEFILQQDVHAAWKYATRAVNCCESMNLPDTRAAMVELVVKLSQQLEFIETQNQSVRIAERREARQQSEPAANTISHGEPIESEL